MQHLRTPDYVPENGVSREAEQPVWAMLQEYGCTSRSNLQIRGDL
jgi:hypothetical protein